MKFNSLIFLLLPLFACTTKSFTNKLDYRKWVFSEESGYSKMAESNKLMFQLVHLPNNLIEQEMEINEREATNAKILIFQFKVFTEEVDNVLNYRLQNKEGYSERVEQLEYEMGSMFKAIASDTLSPVFFHYENYRGLKNEILVHVHFLTETVLQEDLKIYFEDKVFRTGKHLFVFDQDKINHPPLIIKDIS